MDEQLLKQDEEYIQKNADNEYEQNFENDELNMARYEDFGEDNGDLFDLDADVEEIIPEKETKPVKKKKSEKKQKKAAEPLDEITLAHVSLDFAKQFAHTIDPKSIAYSRYKSLSSSQKSKRIKEADKRKQRQKLLKALKERKLSEEAWEQEKFEEKAREFLSHTLDDFKIKNDEEFAAHIQDNFDLYHQSLEMKNQLDNVVSKKISVAPERRQAILKQIGLFSQVGEWMTKKREVMMDRYYPLLLSEDLKDYKAILAKLEEYRSGKKEFQNMFDPLRDFLHRVKAVDDCALNRRELTSSDAGKKAEMTRKLEALANAYAVPETAALQARERAFEEKTTREEWIRNAKEAVKTRTEDPALLKEEKYDKQLFDQVMKEFQALDLSALVFDSVEHILLYAGRNNELFRKGERMHRLLAQAMMNGHAVDTKDIDELRARIFVLNEFKTAQTKLLDVLCTDKVKELEKQPCIEWAKANGVIMNTNAENRKEFIKTQFVMDRSQIEERIRESWKALKHDGQINDAELDEIKKNYDKNLILWERIRYAKDEMKQEDTANSLLLRTLCEEKEYNKEALGDKQLLYYLRGKSREQIEDALKRYNGTTEEKLGLIKEIGDDTRRQLNEEAYEVKPDNANGVLKDLNYKLSMADRIAVADRNIKTAEDLISLAQIQNLELPDELDLKANWKKEMMALKDFGVDHIRFRMEKLCALTEDPKALPYLASFGMYDLFRLKAQKKQIQGALNNAGNQAGDVCAKKIFAAADALVKTRLEVGEVSYGKKQKTASIQDSLNPVYQSYRISQGLNNNGSGFSEMDKQLYNQIDKIHADPAMSSREDLQTLRDLCINVLSDYVEDIPEEDFYDLPTPVLKELAMNRLKYRERTTNEVILAAIREERDKGKRKELDPVEPEWSVKEKEALALISDLVDNKEAVENKEVRVANLRKLLSAHAEILSDLARDKKDPKKAITERKRYLELKELIEMAENIPAFASEEDPYLDASRVTTDMIREKVSKLPLTEEEKEKEIARQEKALKVLSKSAAADKEVKLAGYKKVVEDRLAKEGKTLEELKNELNDLIRNIPAVREIEDMEARQAQLQLQQQQNEARTGKLLKNIDSEEETIRSLEKRRAELLNTKDLNAAEILDQEAELQENIEWYTYRASLNSVPAEKKKGYEEKKKELENELAALKKSEDYKKALDRKAEVEKTADYTGLEAELSASRQSRDLLQEELEKEQADRKKIEEELKKRAAALTELQTKPEKEEMDILETMAQRLAVDSPEKRMVKAVDAALAKLTDYLMVKTGDQAFKLKDIRNLIDNAEDAELNRLLEAADQKIEETIKGTYDDIANIVQTSADFVFESIRDRTFDKTREFSYEFTHHGPVEAFKEAKYTEEDKAKDREKEEAVKRAEIDLKADLVKEYNELEKKWQEQDAELNRDKPQEERIFVPKSSRQMELQLILPGLQKDLLKEYEELEAERQKQEEEQNKDKPQEERISVQRSPRQLELLERFSYGYSAMKELLPMRVQWTRWNAERDMLSARRVKAEKKKNEGKSKGDEGYIPVPKSKREQALDELLKKKPERMELLEKTVKPLEDSDAEGFYMRYAKNAFRNDYDEHSPVQKTLTDYYGDAWAPDEREEKKEGSLKTGAGEGVFVKTVLQNYFSRVNEKSKRTMMTSLFRNLRPEPRDIAHERTNNIRHAGMYLGGLLRGAGPLAQKLMQGVPEEYLSLEMKNAVEDVKSRLSPIPDAEIKQKFQEMIDKSGGKVTDIKKLRSLGAASVGQALLCELTMADGNTKQVVIKLLRPGVKQRVEEDAAVILQCAEETSPGMKKTYEGQLKKIQEELDLRIEAKNCRDAVKAYKDDKDLTTTVQVLEEIPEAEDYLLLDKADGITVDRYLSGLRRDVEKLTESFYYWKPIAFTDKKTRMDVFKLTRQNVGMKKTTRLKLIEMLNTIMKRQKNIQKMTELWIEQSLFGSGFYHGDMHAGNIMISDQKATFLDYGNATKLKDEEVKNILGMNAAAMFKDARVFLDRFLKLIPEEQLKALSGEAIENEDASLEQRKKFTEMKNQIRQDIFEIFRLGKIENAGDRVFLALQVIQKYGIEIPIQIYSYCQSQLRLSNTLDELNRLEEQIRARISELDRAIVDIDETYGDILLKACREGNRSGNPEFYFKSLSSAAEEIDDKTFLEELNNFDEQSMKAFKSKYLSTPTVIDELLAGTHVVKGDYDEEDEVAEKVVIETEKWEQDYKLWMEEFKTKKTKKERDELYEAKDSIGSRLLNTIFNTAMCGATSNGLLDSFGGYQKLNEDLHDAIREGDEAVFRSLMDVYKTYIKAGADVMTKYRRYVEKYSPKTGFFSFFSFKAEETAEKKKEREQEALEILKDLRTLQRGAAERHGVIFETTRDLNYDRMMKGAGETPAEAYSYSEFRIHKVETMDYTQLNTIKAAWKSLNDLGDDRTPDQEEEYKKLGNDLSNCYRVYLHTAQLRVNVQPTFEQNLQAYYMLQGGDKLKEAYKKFSQIRDRDIEARLKRWDDNTFQAEREKASKEFMSIYVKVAAGKLRDQADAFSEKVPEKVMEKILDDNMDEQDVLVNYGCVLNRVLNKGFSIGGLTGNKMKLGLAIGKAKAESYYNQEFEPGKDLIDNVEDLKKPVRK